MSQSSMVVLPIHTEQKKLMWVHSRQINQQAVGTAEMQEAFDRFPYLTSEEMAALAQRCSVHPDQVKVWFMAQRLHYGISWECEDIRYVRETLMPTGKRERKEGEEEDGTAIKRMEKKRRSNGKDDKSKGGGAKKQNMGKAADKGKKRRVMKDENRLQTRSKKTRAAINKDSLVVQFKNRTSETSSMADRLPALLKSMNLSRTSANTSETSATRKKIKAEAPRKRETTEMNGGLDIADAPSTGAKQPMSGSCAPLIHGNLESGSQLSMMRAVFLQCPYPKAEYYAELADVTGIPRKFLVQWFCNMRYYIKTAKPRWMTTKQHRQTVTKIKNQQDGT